MDGIYDGIAGKTSCPSKLYLLSLDKAVLHLDSFVR